MGCGSSSRYRQKDYDTESDELGYAKKYQYSLLEADEGRSRFNSFVEKEEPMTVITELPMEGGGELLTICRGDHDNVAKCYVHFEKYIYEGSFFINEVILNKFRRRAELCIVCDSEDDGRLEIQAKEDKSSVFPIELLTTCSVTPQVLYDFFILPGIELCQRTAAVSNTKEVCVLESKITCMEWEEERVDAIAEDLQRELKRLRLNADTLNHQVMVTRTMMQKEFQKFNSRSHILDVIYNDKGAKPFQHHPAAVIHRPTPVPINNEFVRVAQLLGVVDDERAGESKLSECFKYIDDWDFDIFKFDEVTGGASLLYLGIGLSYYYGIPQKYGIKESVLVNFWQGLHAGYHANPYHNQVHAADVLQITHFIMKSGLTKMLGLTAEDHFAAIIAAAAHDYDHPGLNNNFHSKTRSYLSTLYSDRSLLENHHCACLFESLRHEECDILSTFNSDSKKSMRDIIVEMILSTDMGIHAKIVSVFKRRLHDTAVPLTRRDDLRLCLSMVLKTADISNCCRPLNLYTQWADRIADEFYNQGDAEKILNNQISPFMDRRKHASDFPNGQVSFINYIVAPLFELMIDFLPELSFTADLHAANKTYWNTILKH